MNTTQPEALRLANILRGIDARSLFANEKLSAASAALENQHARITELESQLAQRFDAADMATAAAQGFRDGAIATAQPVAEPADTVVLNAAMRAIQQAIELIGAPTDERMRAVRRVLRGAVIVAEDAGKVAPRPDMAYAALPTRSHTGRVYEEGFLIGTCPLYTADQLRAFADATCALRASHGQAPAGATKPTEQQILEAAEKAGLWPNTVHSWIPAFHRYHKELAKAQPAQAQADSGQEDAARLDWLLLRISGAEFRRLGVHYSGNARRADVDAARKQGVSHDR